MELNDSCRSLPIANFIMDELSIVQYFHEDDENTGITTSKLKIIDFYKNFGNDGEEEEIPPQPAIDLCFFCAKEGSLKQCTGCRKVFYCSLECQRQNWIHHRVQCKVTA